MCQDHHRESRRQTPASTQKGHCHQAQPGQKEHERSNWTESRHVPPTIEKLVQHADMKAGALRFTDVLHRRCAGPPLSKGLPSLSDATADHGGLQVVARRVVEQPAPPSSPTSCVTRRSNGYAPLARNASAARTCAACGGRRLRAAPPRSGSGTGRPSTRASRGRPPNATHRAARAGRARAPRSHASTVPAASITMSAPSGSAATAPNERRERAPLLARADARPARRRRPRRTRTASARSARARRSRRCRPRSTPATSTPWRQQASGSVIAATSGASAGGNGQEVRARDPLGHEQELGVGAVEEREEVLAERLLAPAARRARRRTAQSWPARPAGRSRRRSRRPRARTGSAAGRGAPGGRGGRP